MRVNPLYLLILAALDAGCEDDLLETERSLRVALQAVGLPEGVSAEYRIFVDDTVGIAHGEVACPRVL
jgi:hypothetical protein